jgi:hypothetical protein
MYLFFWYFFQHKNTLFGQSGDLFCYFRSRNAENQLNFCTAEENVSLHSCVTVDNMTLSLCCQPSTVDTFFFCGKGPTSRCYGCTTALRLLVQPCDEDERWSVYKHLALVRV